MNEEIIRKPQCEKCNKIIILKSKTRIFLCGNCKTQSNLKRKLDIFKESKLEDEYSQYLYDLYLKYMERYFLKYELMGQADRFFKYLSLRVPEHLASWEVVFKESNAYDKKYNENKHAVSCPFIKIGKMVEELGVLPPKSEDRSQYYRRILTKYPPNILETINKFILFEKRKRLLDKTIILHLEFILKFINWLDMTFQDFLLKSPKYRLCFDINHVSESQIQDFLNYLKNRNHSHAYIMSAFTGLSIFFRWSKFENIILVNPCENIKLKKSQSKLIICDDGIIKKLLKFIKDPKSNPEQAMILSLILIWGLRSEDLSHAKIEIQKNTFKIILRRKKLGTRKFYNRCQVLNLPNNPSAWFYKLQKRFYKNWLLEYRQRKKSFPCYNLLLPRYRSIRPLTRSTILARVYEATQAAVGMNIPPKILRKTCGHIHSTSSDSSILSTLGWSADYCFDYTWVPKVYFQDYK